MPGVIASLPAIKSLRADIEVTADEASIATTRVIIIKPLKSFDLPPVIVPLPKLELRV